MASAQYGKSLFKTSTVADLLIPTFALNVDKEQ